MLPILEPVIVLQHGLGFLAKLDTGAGTSSLNSSDIEIIDVAGQQRVRFRVKDDQGKHTRLELPLVKEVKIKRHFTEAQKRPVVVMDICIDDAIRRVPVNLVDRSRFKYQLLLGRSFLEPGLIVDSATMRSTTPRCSGSLSVLESGWLEREVGSTGSRVDAEE